jgi:hypothetical protein
MNYGPLAVDGDDKEKIEDENVLVRFDWNSCLCTHQKTANAVKKPRVQAPKYEVDPEVSTVCFCLKL